MLVHKGEQVSIHAPEVNHSTASYSGRTRHSRNAMFRVLGLEVFSRIPPFLNVPFTFVHVAYHLV